MSVAAVIERSRREKESWRYTDVQALLAPLPVGIKPAGAKEPEAGTKARSTESDGHAFARFLFVDGVLQPDRSATADLPADILQGDPSIGYRLVLAGQTCLVTLPIELRFVTTSSVLETNTRLQVELGENGRLTLIEHHEAPPGATPVAHVMETEIVLHEQAKLVHGKVMRGNSASAHLALTRVTVAEGGYYDSFALTRGGRVTRNEIEARLTGQLAQCTLNGAMLLRGREHADTTTHIIHAAPHGTSRQVYKTVLGGQSHGVFQGKIIVAEGAQKTDGYQMSRALLLSDQAEMAAKPELEIYADDVKCSHGSTVGDLDPEALFYLRARGLDEAGARGMLIRAFVDEIFDEIHVPEWRAICQAEVEGWLDA
ncbi:MAG: Fe-S cluster assembly protein SufD [Pseudomonadota bacterium]|nr:Fe-S cluster assembly protein SufD [Pseudomonadota bacterium]